MYLLWNYGGILRRLQSLPILGNWFRYFIFGRLANNYDIARGFANAQEEVKGLIQNVVDDPQLEGIIGKEKGTQPRNCA